MSKTIYKYALQTTRTQTIRMPADGRILAVQIQNDAPYIWVECDPDFITVSNRTFAVVGTGHDVPEDGAYIGTWQIAGFVWHLYEVKA